MDNDNAGYASIWRTLEKEVNNLPVPSTSEMDSFTYQVYLQNLSDLEFKGELFNLYLHEPEGFSWKIAYALAEYDTREDVRNWKDPLEKYIEAMK
jgi:hypothetical protein